MRRVRLEEDVLRWNPIEHLARCVLLEEVAGLGLTLKVLRGLQFELRALLGDLPLPEGMVDGLEQEGGDARSPNTPNAYCKSPAVPITRPA